MDLLLTYLISIINVPSPRFEPPSVVKIDDYATTAIFIFGYLDLLLFLGSDSDAESVISLVICDT